MQTSVIDCGTPEDAGRSGRQKSYTTGEVSRRRELELSEFHFPSRKLLHSQPPNKSLSFLQRGFPL